MLAPKMEARLIQALTLQKTDKVLEIGTGSGYVTALLAKLSDFVYSIEIDPLNKQLAVANLTRLGCKNINLIEGDGLNGLASKAPFDKILVGGAVTSINSKLKEQLKVGGKLVAIVGSAPILQALVIEKMSLLEYKDTTLFETYVDYLVSAAPTDFKF